MVEIARIHRKEYGADRCEDMVIAEAPGRVHYLGEHGAPKAGLFLSSAINRYVQVAVSGRRDSSIRFFAADTGERKRTTLVNLKFKREDRWSNYIKVGIHVFAELGYPAKGLNVTVSGDIPQHIGLASSQAVEVAAAVALRGFFRAPIENDELVNRLTESHGIFFEKPVVPVDYAVALFAQENHFLIADETALEVTPIEARLSEYTILIMDSKVSNPKAGVEEELKMRRKDIKKGLALVAQKKPGTSLREFGADDLIEYNLPEEIRRRSMHIIQELRRVSDAEEALEKTDIPGLSKIIFHSHESLRDLYEVSCPEIDWLVKRAQETEGVIGARMTGQGFGGCTYTIIKKNAVEEYRRRLEDYERIFGFHPVIYEVKLAEGARLISP